ncbi:MAG: type II secretion system minor pseudopilin GspJ [Sedimenticola sp.]
MMRRAPTQGHEERGFTLLELMVAIALFSVTAAIAYAGLDGVLRAKSVTESRAERQATLEIGLRRIQQDIEQMIDRPVRDARGETLPSLYLPQTDILLEFTRAGGRTLENNEQSTLRRVAYRFENNRLLRLSWSVLDRSQAAEPVESPLFSGIEGIEIRYHDGSRWRDYWPPEDMSSDGTLPKGVEIRLMLRDWGEIRRVFHVAG